VRSAEVADKIALHLAGFGDHLADVHGHERVSTVVTREVVAWPAYLNGGAPIGLGLAAATVNAHLASLSGFRPWVVAHEPAALPHGNPCAKVSDLPLPPLEPRALDQAQIRSLKNVFDRLGRCSATSPALHQPAGSHCSWLRRRHVALPNRIAHAPSPSAAGRR
jgi:hypothetical protein